jgi:hypothetical protein
MYDLIGDIHGHADELEELLQTLGYRQRAGLYRHPEQKVVFLGDFIDRGPKIRRVLEIVRPMVEEGTALAVMGNHELNALAFHAPDPDREGAFLRPRSNKNIRQHGQTILQLSDKELVAALQWFWTLPLWLELDGLRVVHACWDDGVMSRISATLNERLCLTPELLCAACAREGALFAPVEIVLEGKEAALPDGVSVKDKDGHVRTEIRTRWYLSPEGQTYRKYALQSDVVPCDLVLDPALSKDAVPYPRTAKPVFVGHYWLAANRPELLADNVACLDFSVAKGGFLCAYRWSGEETLSNENFVWINK